MDGGRGIARASAQHPSLLLPRISLAAGLGLACVLLLVAGNRAEVLLRLCTLAGFRPPGVAMGVLRFEDFAWMHPSWAVATACCLFAVISLGVRARRAYFVAGVVACALVLVADQVALSLLTDYFNTPQALLAERP